MKVVTAAAVLERSPQATERPCRFVGSPYYLAANLLDPPTAKRVHSSTFVQALAMSNNQCFAQLAVHELGSPNVVDAMQRLGLLEPPAPGHQPGEVDPVGDRLALGKLGSGLAGSRISPLAAARLGAVLVEGQVIAPRWIERVRDAQGVELRLPDPVEPRAELAPDVAATLRSMMVETTERGTARRAFHARDGRLVLDPVPVAGKTGTLNGQNPDGLYEWFIGVAPADAPRVAIATLVVSRGRRHVNASQVAAQVLRAVFCDAAACRPEPALPLRPGAPPRETGAQTAALGRG
jgi:cell division protein FtsI/penicillin-binding protein 2